MEAYRAPVPDSLAGGEVVSTEQFRKLAEESAALLIDVLPRPPKPKGLDPSILWRPQPRYNIPGSIWLPNVGYGALTNEMTRYFKDVLVNLTEGNLARTMVFYCQADCWMSWNAAKRAIELGYRRGSLVSRGYRRLAGSKPANRIQRASALARTALIQITHDLARKLKEALFQENRLFAEVAKGS